MTDILNGVINGEFIRCDTQEERDYVMDVVDQHLGIEAYRRYASDEFPAVSSNVIAYFPSIKNYGPCWDSWRTGKSYYTTCGEFRVYVESLGGVATEEITISSLNL